ncbi:MAG TPA: hypothetical protein V6C52_10275 [Coleofasciculaceae cyanobacterium]|jgi:hypothetical protein
MNLQFSGIKILNAYPHPDYSTQYTRGYYTGQTDLLVEVLKEKYHVEVELRDEKLRNSDKPGAKDLIILTRNNEKVEQAICEDIAKYAPGYRFPNQHQSIIFGCPQVTLFSEKDVIEKPSVESVEER